MKKTMLPIALTTCLATPFRAMGPTHTFQTWQLIAVHELFNKALQHNDSQALIRIFDHFQTLNQPTQQPDNP
jgi:hypothetical protein